MAVGVPKVSDISGSVVAVAGAVALLAAQVNDNNALNAPSGKLLVGGTDTLVVGVLTIGAVFDLTTANAAITMTAGSFDGQQVSVGFVGTDNGFQGVFSVPTAGPANLLALGYAGAQSSVQAGSVGSVVTFTWIAKANGGAGQWLKS